MRDNSSICLATWLLASILVILLVVMLARAAVSQEFRSDYPASKVAPPIENPATGHTHEGDVGKFYETWRQPLKGASRFTTDGQPRTMSCCNRADCRPVISTRKIGNGQFEVEVKNGIFSTWYRVPESIWEDNQLDARESPDGHSHICVIAGQVKCAVRGNEG